MKNVPENELLSAYLDGELTAAEQAEVERLLAESPEARQLIDDLRALSSSLQSLPQCKLGEDLSGQVLRLAERRILSGDGERPKTAAPSGPASQRGETAPAAGPTIRRRIFTPRNFVYAAATVAAAVLVVVLTQNVDRSEFDEIARVSHVKTAPEKDAVEPDKAEEAPGKEAESIENGAVSRREDDEDADEDAEAEDVPEIRSKEPVEAKKTPESQDDVFMPPPILKLADDYKSSERGTAVKKADKKIDTGGAVPEPVEEPAAEPAKGDAPSGDVLSLLEGGVIGPSEAPSGGLRQGGVGERQSGTRGETVPEIKPGKAPSRPVLKESAGLNWENGVLAVPRPAGKAAGEDRPPTVPGPPPKPRMPDMAKSGAIRPDTGVVPEAPSLVAPAAIAPEAMLVVQCEISPDALAAGVFEKVLARNGIVEEDRYEGPAESLPRRKPKIGKLAREEAERDLARQAAIAAFPGGAQGATLVYVQATPGQVQGAVRQLQRFFPIKTAQVPTTEKREDPGRFARNLRPPPTAEEGRKGLFGRRKPEREADETPGRAARKAAPPADDAVPQKSGILRGRKDRREIAKEMLAGELFAAPAAGLPASNRVLFVLRVAPPVGVTAAEEAGPAAADVPAIEAKPAPAPPAAGARQ